VVKQNLELAKKYFEQRRMTFSKISLYYFDIIFNFTILDSEKAGVHGGAKIESGWSF